VQKIDVERVMREVMHKREALERASFSTDRSTSRFSEAEWFRRWQFLGVDLQVLRRGLRP